MAALPAVKIAFTLVRQVSRPLVQKVIAESKEHPALRRVILALGSFQYHGAAWTRQWLERAELEEKKEEEKKAAPTEQEVNEQRARDATKRSMDAIMPKADGIDAETLGAAPTAHAAAAATAREHDGATAAEAAAEEQRKAAAELAAAATKAASVRSIYGWVPSAVPTTKRVRKARKGPPPPTEEELIERGTWLLVEIVVYCVMILVVWYEWRASKYASEAADRKQREKFAALERRVHALEAAAAEQEAREAAMAKKGRLGALFHKHEAPTQHIEVRPPPPADDEPEAPPEAAAKPASEAAKPITTEAPKPAAAATTKVDAPASAAAMEKEKKPAAAVAPAAQPASPPPNADAPPPEMAAAPPAPKPAWVRWITFGLVR